MAGTRAEAGTGTDLDYTIIGPGALGRSLLAALTESGGRIRSVVSRTAGMSAGTGVGQLTTCQLDDLTDDNTGSVLFITTPDDAIAEVAERLSRLHITWQERIVAHCSGLLSSEVLQPLQARGARVASFHPLQTFAGPADADRFNQIHISVEGESRAVGQLLKMAELLGAEPLRLTPDQKGILHIAAVFLSNYLVVLDGVADQLIRQNIPGSDRRILAPLLERTVSNLKRLSPEKALTGPISRGDRHTVEQHLERLGQLESGEVSRLYRGLGLEAVRLARADGRLTSSQVEELRALLMAP